MNYASMSRESIVKALFALIVIAAIAWQIPFNAGAEGDASDAAVLGAQTETQATTAPLSVTCDASPNPVDLDQEVTWTAHVTGGNTYYYEWTGDYNFPANQSGANYRTVKATYEQSGERHAHVHVVSGQQTADATCEPLVVKDSTPAPQPLSVTCSASQPAQVNIPVTWTAHVTGGNSQDYFAWTGEPNFPGPNAGTSGVGVTSVTQTYANGGIKNASVTVNSSDNRTATAQCSVQISESAPPPSNCNRAADLSASTISVVGGQAVTTVTNSSASCTYNVTMVSYKTGDWDFNPATRDQFLANQEVFDSEVTTLAPGQSKAVSVSLPTCNYQVDVLQYNDGADPIPDDGLVIDQGQGNQYWLFTFDVQLGRGSCLINPPPPPPPSQCVPDRVHDLSATDVLVNAQGRAQSTITNSSSNCSYNVAMVSYKIGRWDFNPATRDQFLLDQQLFDNAARPNLGPGESVTLSVALPQCNYQVDVFEYENGADATPDNGFILDRGHGHEYWLLKFKVELGAGSCFIINQCPAQPTITSTAPSGTRNIGQQFSYTVTTTGGTAPVSIAITPIGTPAPGLTVNGATISGTLTTPGTYTYQVRVTGADSTGPTCATVQTFTITVLPNICVLAAPIITTSGSANGTVGAAFTHDINVAGVHNEPILTGNLPAGLTMTKINSALYRISGTPTTPGISQVTVSFDNECNIVATNISITVGGGSCPIAPPSITSGSTASGKVGDAFSYTVTASGGTPMTFNATNLPSGLTFNSTTATISGTPTTAGTFDVALTAQNQCGVSNLGLRITIDEKICTSNCGDDDDDDDDDDHHGGGGRRRPNVVLFSQPEVAGASISLAQVPYTGLPTSILQVVLFIIGLLAISAAIVYTVTRTLRRKAEQSFAAGGYSAPEGYEAIEVVTESDPYEAEYARMDSVRTAAVAPVVSTAPRAARVEPDFGTIPFKAPVATAPSYATATADKSAALERVSTPIAAPVRAPELPHVDAPKPIDPARIQTEARGSRTLISDDGALLIAHSAEGDEKRALERLVQVIDIAKTRYPREDGWLVLDQDRVRESLFISTLSMIPLFVEWIVRTEDKKVFTFLRMLKHQEQPIADFMRKVVAELDSAHRARLEGAEERAHANAHIAEVTYHLSNKELESIVAELLHGVDERYDSAYTSVRLSLVRVLDMLKERSLRAVGTPYAYSTSHETATS